MTLQWSKVCFLLFSSRFLLLELVFLIILVCFHLCCVFFSGVLRAIFVLCAVVDPSSRQPNSPTTKLARCGFILLTDWESCHTHTTESLTHTHPSPFSPISIVSVHFSSFSALVLSLSLSLFSGPIRHPAVDPESLESVMMCLYIPCHPFLYDFLNRPDKPTPYKFTLLWWMSEMLFSIQQKWIIFIMPSAKKKHHSVDSFEACIEFNM